MSHDNKQVILARSAIDRCCHVCAFFHSRDDEYEVMLPFLKEGLDGGEKIIHIMDGRQKEERLRRLTETGVDAFAAERDGQFEVRPWENAYLTDGPFDQHAMIALVEDIAKDGQRHSSVTRLWGNMEWSLEDFPGVHDIVEYESRLNYMLPQCDMATVCTYDVSRFNAAVIMDVLRTHPQVIVGGILRQNPFYVPPDQFLKEFEARRIAPRNSVEHAAKLLPMEKRMQPERMVHIIDDDASVRRSLEHLLQSAGYATSKYDTPIAVIESAAGLTSGCILLDLRMPGMDGLELHRRLVALDIRLPVIVMTAQGDVPTAVKAIKSGAVDFIEKPFDDQRLLEAIEGALATNWFADRTREGTHAARRIAALSPREKQVLDGLVAGHANKTIAYDLGISVRTVEVHRARLLDRLGTRRLAEAIRLSVLASLG